MRNMRARLSNEEHDGFAISLEVLVTLVSITTFITFTLFFLQVMNVQRYMNTVLTSTAIQAAKYGGTDTNAYRINVSNSKPLMTSAQEALNLYASPYNPRISGSPTKITNANQNITIVLTYSLPSPFSQFGPGGDATIYNTIKNMRMVVTVESVMDPGGAL